MQIFSSIFLIIGGLFLALGGLGIFRMPDSFNRLQAGTKATTLGAFSMLLGVGLYNVQWLPKIIVIILFIAISNPIGSSILAKATYKAYKKPENLVVDELAELYVRGENDEHK